MKRKGLSLLALAVGRRRSARCTAASCEADGDARSRAPGARSSRRSSQQWTPALGSAYDYTLTSTPPSAPAAASRDHEPHGRFRRLRRAADEPTSSARATAASQIPWALSATTLSYNIPDVPKNTSCGSTRRHDRRRSTWVDHELERPGDQGAQPEGVTLPDLKITPVYRTGRLGHDVQVHRLPLARSAGVEVAGRHRTVGELAEAASGRTATRASQASSPTRRARSATSTPRSRSPNHLSSRRSRTRPASFITPGHPRNRGCGGRASRSRSPANNEMHIVNPPKSLPTAYPIATYTYIILPTKSAKAKRAAQDGLLGADPGPEAASTRPSSWFVPIPKVVLVASEKTMKNVSRQRLRLGASGRDSRPGVRAKGASGRPAASRTISAVSDDAAS